MKTQRLALTAFCALVCASGAIVAEPLSGTTDSASSGSAESWGDPEENEARTQTWTWFGMGYERRTRASAESSVPGSQGANGSGQQQQSGRK